jgi:hypothetical protein
MAQGAGGAAGAVDDIAAANAKSAANSQIGNTMTGTTAQTQVFGQPTVANAATPNMGLQGYTPPVPIHSGNISSVPTALQGSGPGGFGAAQPGVFTPGSLGGTSIPAPTPGAVTISRVPSEIYGEQPAKFLTSLPQATPYKGEYFTAGKVEDLVPKAYTNKPILNITEMQRNAAAVAPKTLATDATVNAADVSGQGISRPFTDRMSQVGRGFEASTKDFEGLKGLYNAMPQYSVLASGITLADAMKPEEEKIKKDKSLIRPYEFAYSPTGIEQEPYTGSAERTYFQPTFTALTPYAAPGPEYAAKGGLMGYAVGGSVERMSAQNAIGANTGYPMANINTPMYSNPAMQRPEATNVIAPSADAGVGTYSGEARFARGGEAKTEGGYTYSYDPTTMQFTQTGRPQPVATGRNSTPYSEGRSITNWNEGNSSNRAPVDTSMPANGTMTGGMTQPITQPITQPTSPSQPLIPNINIPAYQTPEQQLGLGGFYDYMNQQLGGMGGYGGYAAGGNVGGLSSLGGYSDGGRLLKGPGDGVSDSIPASIGNRQPARLADGEFVVPARIVSEIGNGSTEAGARKLYAMMDRVQRARRKTVGKGQVARNTKAEKLLPA